MLFSCQFHPLLITSNQTSWLISSIKSENKAWLCKIYLYRNFKITKVTTKIPEQTRWDCFQQNKQTKHQHSLNSGISVMDWSRFSGAQKNLVEEVIRWGTILKVLYDLFHSMKVKWKRKPLEILKQACRDTTWTGSLGGTLAVCGCFLKGTSGHPWCGNRLWNVSYLKPCFTSGQNKTQTKKYYSSLEEKQSEYELAHQLM